MSSLITILLLSISLNAFAKEFKSCQEVIKAVKAKNWKESEAIYNDSSKYSKYEDCVGALNMMLMVEEIIILMRESGGAHNDFCKAAELKQTDTKFEAVFWKKDQIFYATCEKFKDTQTMRTFARKYK